MNGPQHYREAEELLAAVTNSDGSISFGDGGEEYVAAAQVHATLALAAATAEANPEIAAYLPHNKQSVLPWLDVLIAKAPEEST